MSEHHSLLIENMNGTMSAMRTRTIEQRPNGVRAGAEPAIQIDVDPDCICDRPKATVICKCGYLTFQRRMVKVCRVHPKKHFLSDISVCPYCKRGSLTEIQDINQN